MRYTADLNTLPDVRFLNRFSPQGEWTHFRRRSGEFILYYLVDGAMYLREEGESYSLRAGDVILLQPGLLHEGFKAAPCDYYFVHFSGISLLPEQERGEALGGYREGKSEAERCVIPKVSPERML